MSWCLLALLMVGVTGFSGLFTLIWTLGTVATWSTSDTGSKIMMFVSIIATIFLMGLTSMVLEKCPSPKSSKRSKDMTGLEFEGYCGKYLLTHGFHDVRTTPPSGDYGADLVAKDANGVTWVFQCKRYKSKVGNGCVQEVVAAKKHYGASKAAVMTNSQLTQKARELAIENEVILFECMD